MAKEHRISIEGFTGQLSELIKGNSDKVEPFKKMLRQWVYLINTNDTEDIIDFLDEHQIRYSREGAPVKGIPYDLYNILEKYENHIFANRKMSLFERYANDLLLIRELPVEWAAFIEESFDPIN